MQVEEKHRDFDTTKVVCTSKELPCSLQESLEKIAQKEGYMNYKILSRSISTEGGNYMAMLYEVDIKGKTTSGEKETNIFIKQSIPEFSLGDVSEIYCRELFFYNEVSKVFTELEDEAKIPADERYKSAKSYRGSNSEAIILQNLAKDGFTTVFRMEVMPLKFAELSIQQLAKFHSLSLVMERRRPEFFEKKIKNLKQLMKFDEVNLDFCKKMFRTSVAILENETRKKLEDKYSQILDKYINYLRGDGTKFKCLCHGDYRMNNILMKMKEGEITEVVPVDYQIILYGSPMVDFVYFIYGATDREFRKNNLDNLKDLYYETMKNYLKYFEMDVNEIYPRKIFEDNIDECLEFGLLALLFLGPFFFADENEVPDLSKDDVAKHEINVDLKFKDRLQEVIQEMIENGRL
ncbi:hypothetical protein RR48_02336 [Papilio machaon]|uniref:CHK kinase-like domain-containing protein n=1 Tax=Papilio machaon TaxID=76193 RepID=A0A0N0PDU1_PAPMA|nr:hypothetical protein RR48_02336 [Papilio machaon]